MKITIYELLGLVKDGKAPKKIKYQDEEYILNKICLEDNKTHIDYYLKGRELLLFEDIINIVLNINDIVEILEEEKKPKPLTKKDIETLGYACGEIQKCFTNGWTKSLENKPFEEEKKIPEKLDYVHPDIQCSYNESELLLRIEANKDKINSIIDYLKSKGE